MQARVRPAIGRAEDSTDGRAAILTFVRIGMSPVIVRRASLVAAVLRVIWMILGPAILLALAGLIMQRQGYSSIDIWFAAAVAVAVLARLLDIRRFEGTTAGGEPATMAHFWGYTVKLLMAATGGWMIAHWIRPAL